MQSALDSAIGLPSSSTSASWMLGLLMPDEQRRNFTMPSGVIYCRRDLSMRVRIGFAVETGRPPRTHRLRPDPASPPQVTFRTLAQAKVAPTARAIRPLHEVSQKGLSSGSGLRAMVALRRRVFSDEVPHSEPCRYQGAGRAASAHAGALGAPPS